MTQTAGAALQAYLLGSLSYDTVLALQRRLVYKVTGDRDQGFVVLCEHPPLITVGRQGSRAHILFEPDDLRSRQWPVRWVNRGGGCVLHLPGQLAIYAVLALDRLGLDLPAYLTKLQSALVDLLGDFDVRGEIRPNAAGVAVGGRPIAQVGVAVCQWVSYYGAVLNVNPDLAPFRKILGHPPCLPMTSLERERHGPLRMSMVRERLLAHIESRFDFSRTALFFDDPTLCRRAPSDALAASS